MQRTLRPMTLTLLCAVLAPNVRPADQHIAFEPRGDSLLIRANDRPLATYVYRDAEILRPYFKDVFAPGGIPITRHHPPREQADALDHATMHPGLWLAFGDLGGADFWRNKASVVHGGFVRPPQIGGGKGTFTVRNRYMSGAIAICEEICTYTFVVRPTGYLILWDSTFQSDRSGLCFGDQEEMGLGVRVATLLMVKSYENRYPPGRILDDRGRRNEKGIWGQQAAWCDYSGQMGDIFAGVMIMPNPRNTAACCWHVRDYGLMVANPFGRSVFHTGPAEKTQIVAGRPFHLRFGILLHATPDESSLDLVAAYQDYLTVAEPEISHEGLGPNGAVSVPSSSCSLAISGPRPATP